MAEENEKKLDNTQEAQGKTKISVESVPASGFEGFIEANRNILVLVLIVLAAGVGGLYFWKDQQKESEQQAQLDIYKAQYFFGKDSLKLAFSGNGATVKGTEEVAATYDGTQVGKLANYYNGVIMLKEGKFQEAINYLSKFEAEDELVQARAYSLLGDAHTELGNKEEAVNFYKKAAEYKPNKQFTPRYLTKLALAYELNGKLDKAKETYEKIVVEYPKAREASEAKKYVAKLSIAKK